MKVRSNAISSHFMRYTVVCVRNTESKRVEPHSVSKELLSWRKLKWIFAIRCLAATHEQQQQKPRFCWRWRAQLMQFGDVGFYCCLVFRNDEWATCIVCNPLISQLSARRRINTWRRQPTIHKHTQDLRIINKSRELRKWLIRFLVFGWWCRGRAHGLVWFFASTDFMQILDQSSLPLPRPSASYSADAGVQRRLDAH